MAYKAQCIFIPIHQDHQLSTNWLGRFNLIMKLSKIELLKKIEKNGILQYVLF